MTEDEKAEAVEEALDPYWHATLSKYSEGTSGWQWSFDEPPRKMVCGVMRTNDNRLFVDGTFKTAKPDCPKCRAILRSRVKPTVVASGDDPVRG